MTNSAIAAECLAELPSLSALASFAGVVPYARGKLALANLGPCFLSASAFCASFKATAEGTPRRSAPGRRMTRIFSRTWGVPPKISGFVGSANLGTVYFTALLTPLTRICRTRRGSVLVVMSSWMSMANSTPLKTLRKIWTTSSSTSASRVSDVSKASCHLAMRSKSSKSVVTALSCCAPETMPIHTACTIILSLSLSISSSIVTGVTPSAVNDLTPPSTACSGLRSSWQRNRALF
mmetsp:Transcript_4114/g.12013  ORF Transcript_4114/g.12013 Transcript_4114/m.12013 type:complete len:236 (+) Transcript_4114:110-817(+)